MAFNFNRKRFASGANPVYERDFLRVKATLDFPSIAAGANATLTVAVKGASVGDLALVGSAAAAGPLAGLVLQAYVSATDVVTIRASNHTAGALDAASVDYRVLVVKAF